MSTQHSSRQLAKETTTKMKRKPSAKPTQKTIATTAVAAVSPPKTASSTRSVQPITQQSLPSMAQFTFAPTSTRTVVTTTTTTTTTFPPLVFPPPRPLEDLDPRVHPLAQADTPAGLKSFVFNIDGKPTYFHESDDPERSLYELQQTLNELRENQGTISRREEAIAPLEDTRSRSIHLQRSSANRKRPASPISLADVGPRSKYGSLKKRIMHSDVYGSMDDYPPTIQTDPHVSPSARATSPSFTEERGPSYASPHTQGIDDTPMDEAFPTLDATNEDGMLSPDHAMSLPSPTLSPVTGTANPSHEEYFGSPTHALVHRSPTPIDDDDPYTVKGMLNTYSGYPAIMQIPTMCETFDVLPSNVQTYVLWQLLRRCQIPTLQFAAGVIAPTLQRDFLADLPLELSLNILKYLDSKSLCRAGSVSRMWRKIVDADDYIWKHRFEQDGFKLAETDFQTPPDIEEDDVPSRKTSRSSISSTRRKTSVPTTRRSGRLNSTSSAVKRNSTPNIKTSPKSPSTRLPVQRDVAKLPSYKELYRQHHIVRTNWMNPNVKPRHISFQGHGRNVVTCLQFDSDKVISGSDDSTINIYETRTGRLVHTLQGHDGGVWALQYLDNVLVSGSTDRTVRVWDIEKAECTQIFYGHTSTVRCLQIIMPRLQPDGEYFPEEPIIVTGSRDSTLRVWALPKRGSAKYLPTPPEAANEESNAAADPATSPGTTTSPSTVSANPYFLRKLTGHSQSVRALSGAGNTLVSGSYDHTVRVWRISTGECRWRLQGHTAKVYSVVYDVEKDRCFSGSMDHVVKVWDLTRGTNLFTLEGHTSLVGLLDLSNDYLVSAAADSTLRIWNPDTGKCQHVLSAHTGAITCFQHNENMVLSGSDGTLKMWDVRTGEFVRDLLHGLSGVWQIKFDERRCVAAVQRGGITWIDVLTFGEEDGRPVRATGGRQIIPEALNP